MSITRPCLARLCDWKQTNELFAPRFRCGWIKLCENEAVKGKLVCEECMKREEDNPSKQPTKKTIFGLLSEPIPEKARLYGSAYYSKMLQLTEVTPPTSWLIRADEAHQVGIERVEHWSKFFPEELGEGGKMPPKKKVQAATPLPKSQTLMKTFVPIKTMYSEKPDQPKQLPTESQGIWKQEIGGEMCWKSESNHVFLDEDGEIGEFLGVFQDGKLVGKDEL